MNKEYATKWVKDMKQIKVVKRRGQKWTFKTRRRTKTNLYTTTIKLTLIHKRNY